MNQRYIDIQRENGKNIKIIFDNVEILSAAPISIYNKKLFMLSNK